MANAKSKKSSKAKGSKSSKDSSVNSLTEEVKNLAVTTHRSAAGVLTSQADSRDIKIEQFSLSFHSQVLIQDSVIELNFGRRYGLIGANGCGKSTFLKCLAARELPIPSHIDIYLLSEEFPPTEQTAIDAVIEDAKKEVERLEKEMESVLDKDPESLLLDDIYERLDQLDPTTFEVRAATILTGLGFTHERMQYQTKDLSGGWRMRVALARALFVRPTVLLLDQPTNHLDLGACVWLEEYLKQYNRILLIISHSQDFLNNVCTNIIDFTHKKELKYYAGNYDTYVQTKLELEVNQMKQYEKQQAEIEHIKKFIASCGTFSNLVRQAKSRQKVLDKMEAAGLVEKVEKPREFKFRFQNLGKLPPPVISFNQVWFSYSGKKSEALYKDLDLSIDCDTRVSLVGPNGAGKSTLLKLIIGEISPIDGQVTRHSNLKMVRYHQHMADAMDLELSAVQHMRQKFVGGPEDLPEDLPFWRAQVGKFGLTGNSQLVPMNQLSDGQRARVVFADLAMSRPHILLLDEPTNALDIETIDSLADAINHFDGGMVLVSHDFRLISQVSKEIWLCENGHVSVWHGEIGEYKQKLKSEVIADMKLVV